MPDKYTAYRVDDSSWMIHHHKRLGYSRLYVLEGGSPIGWCDLETGVLVAVEPRQHDALMRFVTEWLSTEDARHLGHVPSPHDPDDRAVLQPRRRATGRTTADVLLDVEARTAARDAVDAPVEPATPGEEQTPRRRRLSPRFRGLRTPTGQGLGPRRRFLQRLRLWRLPRLRGRRRPPA